MLSVCPHGQCLSGITRLRPWRRLIVFASVRAYAQHANPPIDEDLTRNIGIIAHIDAGKTTTTERMLYYSGYTRRIGDVDEGSTVTDFLPAERARGITIQSAAISFSWPPVSSETSVAKAFRRLKPRSTVSHNVNLIDTPGHADFTFEVIRSLRVLDGAICILDGVAGVEAQTEKVWTQAAAHQIPRLIFVNKLDRDGAAFGRTVKEIGARLGVWPAVCGIPWWTQDGQLQGIGDVINVRGLKYAPGGDGKQIEIFDLSELDSTDPKFALELRNARTALVELLSEHDDSMVEHYLEVEEDHLAIRAIDVVASLRRCVLNFPQAVVPVLAGASFRNVGVQPLLDAVVDLLPSPSERSDPNISFGNASQGQMGLSEFLSGKLKGSDAIPMKNGQKKALAKDRAPLAIQSIEACALAFKVVADAKKGALVYVRVYSGNLKRMSALWNTNLQTMERAQRLLKMFANDAVDVDSIPAGQIGVIPGLKLARTGDTLISCAGINPKNGPPAPSNQLQLRPIDVPPPVFFVSVEPNSLAEEKHIKESLELLLREDPSLHVSMDEESGQTHLAGMGELHLEIARDRLIQDLKANARIGSIEIGYRESLVVGSAEIMETFDRSIGGKPSQASCTAAIGPHIGEVEESIEAQTRTLADNNRLRVLIPGLDLDGLPITADDPILPDHLPYTAVLLALQNGTNAALARGPTHGYAMHSTDVTITLDIMKHIFPTTTIASLSSAARQAVLAALKDSAKTQESVLMEPLMQVSISVDEDSLGAVVHDLSSARSGNVISLDGNEESPVSIETLTPAEIKRIYAPPDPFAGGNIDAADFGAASRSGTRQIIARVPLKEMVGYLKHLRSLTAGRGNFTMVVDRFERMASQRQKAVLNELRGGDI